MKATMRWWMCAAAFGLAVSAAGCQQPLRCGAIDEPCCAIEGVSPCMLGASCAPDGFCSAGGTSCGGTTGECDLGLQNCGAGRSCQINPEGAGVVTYCASAGGGIDGAPCTTEVDCAAGHFCAIAGNVCRRYCCGSGTCGAGRACLPAAAGSAAGYCFVSGCDYISGSGCGAGLGCYPFMVDGAFTPVCFRAGAAGEGQACTNLDDCASGLACAGDSVCRRFCRPSAPSCSTGTCTPLTGLSDVGFCI